jgi:hypothetical protein
MGLGFAQWEQVAAATALQLSTHKQSSQQVPMGGGGTMLLEGNCRITARKM